MEWPLFSLVTAQPVTTLLLLKPPKKLRVQEATRDGRARARGLNAIIQQLKQRLDKVQLLPSQ